MKKSRFSEAQIAFVLQRAENGTAVGEVCRKAGISEATFYNWRKRYAGLMPSEMKRLRQLEEENGKLKKLVADLSVDRAMLQDIIRQKLRSLPGAGSAIDLEGLDPSGVCCAGDGTIDLPLQEPSHRAGDALLANERDCRHADPLWLQADSRAVAAGGMAHQCQAGLSALSRIGPAIA